MIDYAFSVSMSLLWPPLQLRSLQPHQSVTNSIFRRLALHHENRDCLVASSSRRLLSVNILSHHTATSGCLLYTRWMKWVHTSQVMFWCRFLFLQFGCFRFYLVLVTHLIICHLDAHYTKSLYACLPLHTHKKPLWFWLLLQLLISFSSSFCDNIELYFWPRLLYCSSSLVFVNSSHSDVGIPLHSL